MKKPLLAPILALAAAGFGFTAHAQDATPHSDTSLTKQEAKDLKTQSDAAYKARKKVAGANEDLNKADCKVSAEGAAERDCKQMAKEQKKQDKAEAKAVHDAERQSIKDNTAK